MKRSVPPIFGLVLAGGKSTRMKKDKASLQYHDKIQSAHCFDLLTPLCERVFISKRRHQRNRKGETVLPRIDDHDGFAGIGPLGGILSAMAENPKAAWLVLACDLPFVTKKILAELIAKRAPERIATAYQSRHDGLPEPLCAIYEPRAQARLKKFFKKGIFCPRKILIQSDTRLLRPGDKKALDNVNTSVEYAQAAGILKKQHREARHVTREAECE
jgi:molybdopterin-guanine dinucleotide biosynthesis protein A